MRRPPSAGSSLGRATRGADPSGVTISSAVYPELGRTATAVAIQRQLAHVLLVTDDEQPDQLLADVLDAATAERWLQPRESDEGG